MKIYQSIAKAWRDSQSQNEKHRTNSGIVLIWNNEVYGWKDELRNPESERPNAIAVDTQGQVYVAEGGNDYDGAERWTMKQSLEC